MHGPEDYCTPVDMACHPEKLKQVVEYIHKHMDEPIKSVDLARAVGLSPIRFSRGFHDATGVTVMRFILLCRLGLAKSFLKGTKLPLVAIAMAAGFSSQSHFQSAFKKIEGVTPTAWRAAQWAQSAAERLV